MTGGVNHYHLHANARQQSNQKVVKQEETVGGESDETDAAAALQLLSGTKCGKSQLPQLYGQRFNFTALGASFQEQPMLSKLLLCAKELARSGPRG